MTDFTLNEAAHGLCCKGTGRCNNKLNSYDWLADIPENEEICDLVEVQFKNTRKGYYRNSNGLDLVKGDIVAVEASPGHDIGTVSLTGSLVLYQMKKTRMKPGEEIKRIYRKARPVDMEKYNAAKEREQATMIESRKLAKGLGLEMKIGDVEYQGDGNKAIFYYIADGRVDFRQLIRVLADAFHVRIEMKQIGARQEAGLIGGIGPCGRELCCATWMKNFNSVTTASARYQDLSLNPQKLTGQCAKLKCCLNYEIDSYVEASHKLPSREIHLYTMNAEYYFFKCDILSGKITYSTDKNAAVNCVTISAKRAFQVLNMNRKNEKPDALEDSSTVKSVETHVDLLEQESLTRFDKAKNQKRRKNNHRNASPNDKQGNKNRPSGQRNGNNRNQDGQQRNRKNQDKNGNQQPAQQNNPNRRTNDAPNTPNNAGANKNNRNTKGKNNPANTNKQGNNNRNNRNSGNYNKNRSSNKQEKAAPQADSNKPA